jgi:molybdenum cofactor biosynthesis protein MoaC
MADISDKDITQRVALAGGSLKIGEQAFALLSAGELPKGDPLGMAEVAGIQAAKQTPGLIPLCHPIALNRVMVHSDLCPEEQAVDLYCVAETAGRTGVEMEALTGLSVALLTVWDLVKPVNPALEITQQRLLFKAGGKRGRWVHPDGLPAPAKNILAELGFGGL